jgi:REP element-mobilizing transposase RayT
MSRGNNREVIVHDNDDVTAFLSSLRLTCARYGWRVFAWCIMPNHYHLVLETMRPTLAHGMRRHNSTYAQWFNERHGRVGHVFQGRYKSFVVATDRYLLTLMRYVELNPVRAELVSDPAAWPWSSVHTSLGTLSPPMWSAVSDVWQIFGSDEQTSTRNYKAFLYDGIAAGSPIPIHGTIVGTPAEARRILKRALKSSSPEIPHADRLKRPDLQSIFAAQIERDAAIKRAYAAGYDLCAIASHVGLHYSTVSRVARKNATLGAGATVI